MSARLLSLHGRGGVVKKVAQSEIAAGRKVACCGERR
jgi:hypothetical protein